MEFLNDYRGSAIAHIENDVVFLISGKPVAFLQREYVYAYSGVQIGTYEDGRMRDIQGSCVFYSEQASGFGPLPPIHQIPPIPAVTAIPPIPSIPQVPCIKAIPTMSWSTLSGQKYFE